MWKMQLTIENVFFVFCDLSYNFRLFFDPEVQNLQKWQKWKTKNVFFNVFWWISLMQRVQIKKTNAIEIWEHLEWWFIPDDVHCFTRVIKVTFFHDLGNDVGAQSSRMEVPNRWKWSKNRLKLNLEAFLRPKLIFGFPMEPKWSHMELNWSPNWAPKLMKIGLKLNSKMQLKFEDMFHRFFGDFSLNF